MASDGTEIEAVLKGLSEVNLNNSNPDCVTPSKTHDVLGRRHTSSPSSSGVSGEGEEEELDVYQCSTVSTGKNGEETTQAGTVTGVEAQEGTSPDNELKQPAARSSTPVNLSQKNPISGPMGRYVICSLSASYCPPYTVVVVFLKTNMCNIYVNVAFTACCADVFNMQPVVHR